MPEPHYLFAKDDLRSYLERAQEALRKEIDTLSPDAVLNTNIDEYITYATDKYTMHVPTLRDQETTVDQAEAKVDISRDWNRPFPNRNTPHFITGTQITYYVPFDGNEQLFTYRPSRHYSNPLEAAITGTEITFTYQVTTHDENSIQPRFTTDLATLKQWLVWVQHDISQHNEQLPGLARSRLTERREKLTKDRALVNNLGFPLRQRPGAPNTYAVPVVRKTIPLPPRPTAANPEPTISNEVYEHILSIIQSMVLVMERSPDAFRTMNEETLRSHFLVQLNGQYDGQATGETFNAGGKTDILIRHENKNLFIAECKFWDGPKSLSDAIDQLLGYATWRDTKTSILLFSRNKDFTNVLQQIPGIVTAHPNFLQQHAYTSETGFRFTLNQKDDPQRHLTLTILAFNIPT